MREKFSPPLSDWLPLNLWSPSACLSQLWCSEPSSPCWGLLQRPVWSGCLLTVNALTCTHPPAPIAPLNQVRRTHLCKQMFPGTPLIHCLVAALARPPGPSGGHRKHSRSELGLRREMRRLWGICILSLVWFVLNTLSAHTCCAGGSVKGIKI